MNKKDKIAKLEAELAKLKNETDVSVLNKYVGKYLYFEGYEDASWIAYIDKINKDCTYDGYLIELNTENYANPGVAVNEVHNQTFEEFPYFENAYDWEDECYDNDNELDLCKYLDYWLAYGRYASDDITPDDTREITPQKAMEIINNHLKWYLPKEITGAAEDKYDY